jgi:hypothetical protein
MANCVENLQITGSVPDAGKWVISGDRIDSLWGRDQVENYASVRQTLPTISNTLGQKVLS